MTDNNVISFKLQDLMKEPALQYNYITQIFINKDEEIQGIVPIYNTCEVHGTRFLYLDYVKKLVEMRIDQPLEDSSLHDRIFKIIKSNDAMIKIAFLNGYSEIKHQIALDHCRVLDHNLKLDYAEADLVYHQMKFEFTSLLV